MNNDELFKRRIHIRMRANGAGSYIEYMNMLNKKEEYKALVETIAVNVTEFFRNPESFSTVEKQKNFDSILCRNVLIYFTKEMQDQLYMDFYSALNKGGYLVLGKTGYISEEIRKKFITLDNVEKIFQRTV